MNGASHSLMFGLFDLFDVIVSWGCPGLILLLVFIPIIGLFVRNNELKRRLDLYETKLMDQERRSIQIEQRLGAVIPTETAANPIVEKITPEEEKPPVLAKEPQPEPIVEPIITPSPVPQVDASLELPPLIVETTEDPVIEEPVLEPAAQVQTAQAVEPAPPTPAPIDSEPQPAKPEGSFEERLGKVWLVRVGVVLVLTGLAYLANMGYVGLRENADYKHLIPYINAALLYLVSFGMLGAGLFLHKRFEHLQNYSEVLTGGGMAAVYFSTYALHFVDAPVLGLVPNPFAAGAMLAAWAVLIIVVATRRQSELMAMFAVAGAYYASYVPLIHNPEAGNVTFTFASNIALGVVAVFFVLRNRWANLSFLALITSYAGFAYWRFQHAVGGSMEFWQDALFLIVYWLIFTAAGFLSRHEQLTPTKRSTFVNLNNSACFALVTISLLQVPELRENYWIFPLAFGGLMLGLYTVARRWLAEEKLLGEILLAKAATLVTLAFMTLEPAGKFRALLLGTQAITIMFFALRTDNQLLRKASGIIAVIGTVFAGHAILQTITAMNGAFDAPTLRLGFFFGLLMMAAAAVAKFSHRENKAPEMAELFTSLGMLIALAACVGTLIVDHRPMGTLFIAALGLAALVGAHFTRIRALLIYGEAFQAVSILLWMPHAYSQAIQLPEWQPWALLALVLGAQLWRKRAHETAEPDSFERNAISIGKFAGSIAMGMVFMAIALRLIDFNLTQLSIPLAIAGIAIIAYALAIREWVTSLIGYAFILMAPLYLAFQFLSPLEVFSWQLALVPILVAFACGAAQDRLCESIANRFESNVGTQYALAAIAQSIAMLCGLAAFLYYLPSDDVVWVLPLAGVVLSIVCLGLTLTPGLIAAQSFILFAGALMPLKLMGEDPNATLMFVPMIVILGMSHFLLHSASLVQAEKHPLKTLAYFGTSAYFYYGWVLAMAWGAKYVSGDYLFLLFTTVGVAHMILHQRRARLERLIVAGAYGLVGFMLFWVHTALQWNDPRPMDALPLIGLLAALSYFRTSEENQLPKWAHLTALIILNLSLWQWISRMVPGDYDVISWSGLAFVLISLGLWTGDRAHRLFGLTILLAAIGNVVMLTWTHLGGATRIITFIGMGIILILLGLLYHRFQDKLKGYL